MSLSGKRRASTLATTLVVSSLLFTVAVVAAATSMLNLGFAARVESQRRALALADAAANTALARLLASPEQPPSEAVRVRLPGDPEGAAGLLAFDSQLEGVPPSTCNLLSATACPGAGETVVPAHAVQFLAVGRCGGVERRVRLVVGMPAYPFVLASDGPVIAEQGVLVGSLGQPDAGGVAVPERLQPGDLACNGQGAEAVRLGPATMVVGDVSSRGGIILDPAASVQGETRPYGDEQRIPKVDLDRFDPLRQGVAPQTLGPTLAGQTLAGACRAPGDLWVCGDLELDGAWLYVAGDLEVQGAVQGSGLVVVRGTTRITGGASLSAQGRAVLLGQGNVTLQGLGEEASSFHGLVYTEGRFAAEQLSLVGTFIAQGPGAATFLRQVRLEGDPESTRLELNAPSASAELRFGIDPLPDGVAAVEYLSGADASTELGGRARSASEQAVQRLNLGAANYTTTFTLRVQAGPEGFVLSDSLAGTSVRVPDVRNARVRLGTMAAAHALLLGYRSISAGFDWATPNPTAPEASALETALQGLAQEAADASAPSSGLRGFDLNEFLGPEDRLRVLLRREW